MNVLLVTASYWPFVELGGPPVKVRAIAEGLLARGHRVTVLTADLRGGREARRRPGRRSTEGGVEIRYLPVAFRYRNVPMVRGARSTIRRLVADQDAIQIFGLYDTLGPAVAREARRRGIGYLVEPMGRYLPIVRSQGKKRLFHSLLGRRLLSGAKMVVATSAMERDELAGGGVPIEKLVVRRNGIDLRRFEPPLPRGVTRTRLGVPANEPITLFFGRIADKKHPDLLVDAFADAGAHGRLLFVGPDEDAWAPRLLERAGDRGIRDQVIVEGPTLGDRATRELLGDATILALPSENENFGNAVAEAMACGIPAVITDRCGIAPMVEGRAGIVTPLARGPFAAALERLIEDEELRGRYAEGAIAVAANLSWDEPLDEEEVLLREASRP